MWQVIGRHSCFPSDLKITGRNSDKRFNYGVLPLAKFTSEMIRMLSSYSLEGSAKIQGAFSVA